MSLLALIMASIAVTSPSGPSAPYFNLALQRGDAIETIFERTLSVTATHRISGYSTYLIDAVHGNRYDYTSSYSYYGRVTKNNERYAIDRRSDGLYYIGYTGSTPTLSTDASGGFFNPWVWGTPPAHISAGTKWHYRIPQSWEAGPAGEEVVTVLSIDPVNDRVVLSREGSGVGAPLSETLPKVGGATPTWGKTTWKGIAIVRRGEIESDELSIRHELIVPATATQQRHTITAIEQIELGQVPYDGTGP